MDEILRQKTKRKTKKILTNDQEPNSNTEEAMRYI